MNHGESIDYWALSSVLHMLQVFIHINLQTNLSLKILSLSTIYTFGSEGRVRFSSLGQVMSQTRSRPESRPCEWWQPIYRTSAGTEEALSPHAPHSASLSQSAAALFQAKRNSCLEHWQSCGGGKGTWQCELVSKASAQKWHTSHLSTFSFSKQVIWPLLKSTGWS